MAHTFDSIGLSGASVGVLTLSAGSVGWAPRNAADAEAKSLDLETVLRASWTPIGRNCHLRLFCKSGERPHFDGFRRSDVDTLTTFFESKDIDFEKEAVESGGGNYGTLDFEGMYAPWPHFSHLTAALRWEMIRAKGGTVHVLPPLSSGAGTMAMHKDGKQVFEINLGTVSSCTTPGTKQDELDIQFVDDESASKDDHVLYAMRLWVPGQQAPAMQSRISAQAAGGEGNGEPLVEFDRDMGTFLTPKNRFSVEMHETFLRMRGQTYDFKIMYNDISRFYMLEKPMGRLAGDLQAFYFVICLDKAVRQGQQAYPYLVWQTVNEETDVAVNMEQEAIDEKYPNSGLKPLLEGALHKHIGKVFKVLTGKTVFAGSRKFRSADGNQCLNCNFGQRTGVLYPNDKSFVFLHQPAMVVEYSDVDYVEFVKSQQTKNFELVVQQRQAAGGKKLKFGGIEKKEFNALAEFLKTKDSFFTVRNYEPEEQQEDDDDDDDEEDGDFGSDDGVCSPVASCRMRSNLYCRLADLHYSNWQARVDRAAAAIAMTLTARRMVKMAKMYRRRPRPRRAARLPKSPKL